MVGEATARVKMWYGTGQTLVEAAEQHSLLKQLDDMKLEPVEARSKQTPKKVFTEKGEDPQPQHHATGDEALQEFLDLQQEAASEEKRRLQAEEEEGPDPKRRRPENAGDQAAEDALPGASTADEAEEEAVYKEASDEGKMLDEMYDEVRQRQEQLTKSRMNLGVKQVRTGDEYQESFTEEDIAYQLRIQGYYSGDIPVRARLASKAKGRALKPPLRNETLDEQVITVPTYSKRDYELTMTANYARSKRLLNPKEPDPVSPGVVDVQTLHSEIRFGFSVFAAEKNKRTAGSRYTFRFGEGTCDLSDMAKADSAAKLSERRSNLYRYQTLEPPTQVGTSSASGTAPEIPANEGIHTLEVGSLELSNQPRVLGFPLFESAFLAKASLSSLVYDQEGFVNLLDAANAKTYHRAMRYRFEVMRLWWKLFHNQADLVRGLIELEAFAIDNAGLGEPLRADFSNALNSVIDATKPQMILSIIELGEEGSLQYGKIYPKYLPTDSFDAKKNRNLFKRVDSEPGRPRELTERLQTQPVQLLESYCWPVVMPGMTAPWLDWVAGSKTVTVKTVHNNQDTYEKKIINGVKDRNLQAFQVMRALFGTSLEADYDETVSNMPPAVNDLMNTMLLEAVPDPESRVKNFWLLVEIVSRDLMDAMPYWANAYLCEDLVTHPAEDVGEKERKLAKLKEQIQQTNLDIEVSKQTMSTDPRDELALKHEAEIYDMICKRAEHLDLVYSMTCHSSASSVIWHPYASKMRAERNKDDAVSAHSKTWAQESLHRSILGIYDSSWLCEYYSTNSGPGGAIQRSYDGTQITEGDQEAAALYRQWYSEVYLGLGDDGVAMPGQVVIMTNLVRRGRPVLEDRPGTVQLQGHAATIVARVPRPSTKGKPAFPPFDYLLETQFDFIGTVEDRNAALAARPPEISPANKWQVTLSGSHIFPFRYNNSFRYGDKVEVIELDESSGLKPAAIIRNNKMYRGTDRDKPRRWSVVEMPYYGPPSLLKQAEYDAASDRDKVAQHTKEIGAIVLSEFNQEQFAAESNKDEYLRWPVTLVGDKAVLSPLDEEMPAVTGSMTALNPYRNSKSLGEARNFMFEDKVKLLFRTPTTSALETDDYGGEHACMDERR